MSRNPEEPSEPTSAENAGSGTVIAFAPLPLRQLLTGLFFYPRTFFLIPHWHHSLGRALRLVTGLCLLSGMALATVKLPRVLTVAQDWATWFAQEMQAVWIKDGQIHWERPRTLPYTTRHRGWRVDFRAPGTPLLPASMSGPERRGVWITADRILLWSWQTHERVESWPLLDQQKIGGVLHLEKIWPDGFRLEGNRFQNNVRRLVLQAAPVLVVQQCLTVFVPVLMYAAIFSLATLLLRGPLALAGFKALLTFHLYASIPPLVIAALYSGLGLAYLQIETVFLCAFVAYLVIVFSGLRRVYGDGRDGGRTG